MANIFWSHKIDEQNEKPISTHLDGEMIKVGELLYYRMLTMMNSEQVRILFYISKTI